MTRFDIVNSDDTMLCFSSLYWLSGLLTLLIGTLNGATRLITTELFSPELLFRLIEQYKVTFVLNTPYQMVLSLKNALIKQTDLSSLKKYFVGGSKVPFGASIEFNKCVPNAKFFNAYGMSELSGVASSDFPESSGRDTVGQLVSGLTVKIIDGNGKRCGVNINGEICLKSQYKFIGYYGNQAATDELFDKEEFLLSGDIGYFDEDGYLYLVDRKKDLLKYCNFQISPSEIEAYLIESPDIKSVCVVGIPDDIATDLPAAVIIRNENSNITDKQIYKMVAGET